MITKWVSLGLYLLLALLPFQIRYIITPSDNQFGIISLYLFDIILVLLGIIWLWYWYTHKTIKPQWQSIWLGLVIVLLGVLSSYFADDQTVALYYWIQLALGLWLIAIVATVPLQQSMVLSIFVINGLIQAGAAIIQFITQHVVASTWLGIAAQTPETSGVAVVVTTTGRWLRSYALMPHPNVAAGIMVLALVALALLSYKKIFLIGVAMLSFGAFLTFSRSALIVWCLMLIGFIFLKKISAPLMLTSLLTLVVSSAVFWPLVSSRTLNEQYVEQLSITERQDQWQNFAELLPRYWPQGIGLGQYALDHDQPIHNVPLMMIIELGVFATIIWYWFIFRKFQISHPSSYLLITIFSLGLFDHYWWTLPSVLLLWMFVVGWSYSGRYHSINQK